MKKIITLMIILSNGYFACAQNAKREMIKSILPLTEIGNSVATNTLVKSPLISDHIGITDQQISEVIDKFISNGMKDLADSLLNIYDSLLTTEEIERLNEFFNSPAGRTYRDLLPLITGRSIGAVYEWYQSNQLSLLTLMDSVYSSQRIPVKGDFIYSEIEIKKGKPYNFRRKAGSGSVYTDPENLYKVYYNSRIWEEIDPSALNPSADIAFKMDGKEVYAIILAESDDLNIKELRYAAIYNLNNVSSMYEIIANELRNVNKTELFSMQFRAVVDSVEINYQNYYYTDNQIVIQFSTFAGYESYQSEKNKMEDLLNGLVIIK